MCAWPETSCAAGVTAFNETPRAPGLDDFRKFQAKRAQRLCGFCFLLLLAAPFLSGAEGESQRWFAPCAIAADTQAERLFVAGERAREVVVLDLKSNSVVACFRLGQTPTGVAMEGKRLFVTCSEGFSNLVLALDCETGAEVGRAEVGPGVCAPLPAHWSGSLYVCERFGATAALLRMDSAVSD